MAKTNPTESIEHPKVEKIEITKVNGYWLVNGKPYTELQYLERVFFDEFIVAMKLEYDKEDKKIILRN